MKKIWKKLTLLVLTIGMISGLYACGSQEGEKDALSGATKSSKSEDTSEVANTYYLDLTELGMKLTIYLQLDETGHFLFSNTLDFTTDKASGTFQKSEDTYVMVYRSVNGEETSVSEGITASFTVMENGNLDFSGSDAVAYGSAKIQTVSAEDATIKLIAQVVTEEFTEPSTESVFQTGTYTTEVVQENGIAYTHMISFYEDNTYLHFISYEENQKMMFASETGTYGISTSQLALQPDKTEEETAQSNRMESEIVDSSNLIISVYPYAGATERISMHFTKTNKLSAIASLYGSGTVTGSTDTFSVELTVYEDGSYETIAEAFTESGFLALNSVEGIVKQYPNHPETGEKGLSQVATVPVGTLTLEADCMQIELRVRTSESLTRYPCVVSK